jgi:PRMT5 oligomerisation domain
MFLQRLGRILRSSVVWEYWTQHPPPSQGQNLEGHAELVPAVLPFQGLYGSIITSDLIYSYFQEPLYIPSNSELQVSIWRLTNQRQVWYEWHAESFLSVFNAPTVDKDQPSSPPRSASLANGGSFFTSSPSLGTASPLIDAVDVPPMERRTVPHESAELVTPSFGTVKIGQTSLHNPGGRSSWIGL